MAISPDGKWLAVSLRRDVGRSDSWGAVWLLNLADGGARLIDPGPEPATGVTFSQDSKLLGLGKWEAVRLWDVATGNEVAGLMPHVRAASFQFIAFSPDGTTLAAAKIPLLPPHVNLLHLWDRRTGEPLKLSTSYQWFVDGLAFSPDGTQLAVSNNKHISLLDVRERQEVYRFNCRALCTSPSFSPDGKFIAASDKHGLIYVWDVDTGKVQAPPLASTATACSVISLVFFPFGETLTAVDKDNGIRFWDVPSGREVRRLAFPKGAPCPFFFTRDGKTLVGGGPEPNPVVHMWDANTGRELRHWDLTPVLNGQKP